MIIETNKGPILIDDNERQPCEIWTRVMGYYRPLDNFNRGKKQEHADRLFFKVPGEVKE